jgi:hypothetical protein
MADIDRSKSASLSSLLVSLRKIFPQYKADFCERVPEILNMDPSEKMTSEEWNHMFDWRRSSVSKSPQQRKTKFEKSMSK